MPLRLALSCVTSPAERLDNLSIPTFSQDRERHIEARAIRTDAATEPPCEICSPEKEISAAA
jgi:hypothetical protein